MSTGYYFLGVINPDGFAQVEFRELEGKTDGGFEGDLKYIFGDDFYFAGSDIGANAIPTPAAFAIGLVGLALAGLGRR